MCHIVVRTAPPLVVHIVSGYISTTKEGKDWKRQLTYYQKQTNMYATMSVHLSSRMLLPMTIHAGCMHVSYLPANG